MSKPTLTGLCDACDSGHKLPARYHGLDCPKRQPRNRGPENGTASTDKTSRDATPEADAKEGGRK